MEGHVYGLRTRWAFEHRTAVEFLVYRNDPTHPIDVSSAMTKSDFDINDYSFFDEKSKKAIESLLNNTLFPDVKNSLIKKTKENNNIFTELNNKIFSKEPSNLIKKLDIDVFQHGFSWICPLQIHCTLDLVFNKTVVSVIAPFAAFKNRVIYFPSCDVPQSIIDDVQRIDDQENIHVVVFHGKWCRFVISSLEPRPGFRLHTTNDLEAHEIKKHLLAIFPSLPKLEIEKEMTMSEIIAHVPFETNTMVLKDVITNFFDHALWLDEVNVVSSKKNVTVKGFIPKVVAEKRYLPDSDELVPIIMSVNPMDTGLKIRLKRVKDSSLKNIFQKFVSHLVSFIEEKQPSILRDYERELNFPTPVIKMKQRSSSLPQDGLFVTNYSRICKKANQPIIISKEEAIERNMENVLLFPKHMMFNVPPRCYTCREGMYIGLKQNSLANKEMFPLVPACFMTDQIGKPSVTSDYINGTSEGKLLNNVSKRFSPLQKENSSSSIPDTLQKYLSHIFENTREKWVRTFIGIDYLKLLNVTRGDLMKFTAFGQAQFPGESENTIKKVVSSTPFLSTVKFKKIIESAAKINIATFMMNDGLEISFGTENYQDELFDNFCFDSFIIFLEFTDRRHVEVVHVDKNPFIQTKMSALIKMFRHEGRSYFEYNATPKQIVNAYGYVVNENMCAPIHPLVPIEFEKREKDLFDEYEEKRIMANMLFGAFCHAKLIGYKIIKKINENMSLGNDEYSNLFSDCPFMKINQENGTCMITVPDDETFNVLKSQVDRITKRELSRFRTHNPLIFEDQNDFKRGNTTDLGNLNTRLNGFGAIEVLSTDNISTARRRKLMKLSVNNDEFDSKFVYFEEKPSNFLMRDDLNCLFFDQMRKHALMTRNNSSDVFFVKVDPINDSTGPLFLKRNLFSTVIQDLTQVLGSSDPDYGTQIVENVIEKDDPIFFENFDSQEDPKKKD